MAQIDQEVFQAVFVVGQLKAFLDSDLGKTALTILKEERENIVFTSPAYQPCAFIDGDGIWVMALDFNKRLRITIYELIFLSEESKFIPMEDLLDWFLMSLGLIAQKHLLRKHAKMESLPH